MFWVISVYFNIRNILPKSGTFILGHPVYERETFYNTDLTYILPTAHADMIVAGDFNCILSKIDSTGTNNYSGALGNIVN